MEKKIGNRGERKKKVRVFREEMREGGEKC